MSKIKPEQSLPLSENWAYKVALLADLVARSVTVVVQHSSGLNLSQWRVLAAIADQPGRTASQVVEVTPMDKGLVSRAVKNLADRGFIERRASQTDSRLAHLVLTANGKKVYRGIVENLDENGASGRNMLAQKTEGELVSTLDALIQQYKEIEKGPT